MDPVWSKAWPPVWGPKRANGPDTLPGHHGSSFLFGHRLELDIVGAHLVLRLVAGRQHTRVDVGLLTNMEFIRCLFINRYNSNKRTNFIQSPLHWRWLLGEKNYKFRFRGEKCKRGKKEKMHPSLGKTPWNIENEKVGGGGTYQTKSIWASTRFFTIATTAESLARVLYPDELLVGAGVGFLF